MTVEFMPKIKQVFPVQSTDLLAFVAEVPATTLTLVMSDEKLNDHWRPATLPEDAMTTGRLTVPPGTPEPDPRVSVTPCPKVVTAKASKIRNMETRSFPIGRVSARREKPIVGLSPRRVLVRTMAPY